MMGTLPKIYTAHDLETPLTLDYARAYQHLREGALNMEHGLMRWGSNYTFLVSCHHEDVNFLTVYKPRMGERPLWDFPDGTLCQREVAAYVVSEMLGWHLVPPTLLRDGPRGIGSAQVFINHNPEEHYFNFADTYEIATLIPQFKRMAVLDVIINNADRKGGHCLIDEAGRLWGIDHGLTFNTAHKLRTVIWDFSEQAIDAAILTDLQTLCAALDQADETQPYPLSNLLTTSELQMLKQRVERLLQTAIYPPRGRGPNVPWPAI